MALDREQSPRKLVYLRDRAPRAKVKQRKQSRRQESQPGDELASEAIWLARCLLAIAVINAVYWILVTTGSIQGDNEEARRWLLSSSVSHVFVACSGAIGAALLYREVPRALVYVALSAGAMIVVALEGLARLFLAGDLAQLTLAARADILARAASLALGIWATSYVLRVQRRRPI
jgi:hypothetical protein